MKCLFPTLLSILALVACSSTPTKVDTGPIKARTFAFVDRGPTAAPAYADQNPQTHAAIQYAITRNLAGRGLARVNTGGDVTVGYLLIIGNNATTTSMDEYFGYSSDAGALVDKVHTYQTTKNDNPNFFEAGTIVIDLVDSRSHALLRRNYAMRPILRDPSPEVRSARLQEAIDAALKDLRIAN